MRKSFFRNCPESGYVLGFDPNNGAFFRIGNDGIDPFCNIAGPELLDISITNYCERNCDFCYRASHQQGSFMPLDDYKMIMEQAQKAGVLQVALGGGNPNQHPQFVEILKTTRKHHIIPSYTTNGQGMTPEIYAATKKYCGALAVSWYEPYLEAKEVVRQAGLLGITINIHFLLNKSTLTEAIDLLDNGQDFLKKINALVFLNFKPVHTSESLCLTDGFQIKAFFDSVKKFRACSIGFDSCMISYLPLMADVLVKESIDFCEAGRFSAFVSEDLFLYPCSFLNDISKNGINLKLTSLAECWRHGEAFVEMREKLNTAGQQNYPISECPNCFEYEMCHGGCQIFNINRCRETILPSQISLPVPLGEPAIL
jgi:radical SAM protein with 4Fe4S-binding SPASM domain